MTRKKVKLAFIENDAKRKATYNKRKKGLLNKVNEIVVLCGIHACAIIYSLYDSEPVLWPSELGVKHVISDFQKIPKADQTKKTLDQEAFMRQRIRKLSKQLKKQQIENYDIELTELMYQILWNGKGKLQNMTLANLNDLGLKVEQNLIEINKRIEDIENTAFLQQVAQPGPAEPQDPVVSREEQNPWLH